MTEVTSSDCRTEDGVTVGLIDSVITMLQLLKDRDLTSEAAQAALKDLASQEGFASVLRAVAGATDEDSKVTFVINVTEHKHYHLTAPTGERSEPPTIYPRPLPFPQPTEPADPYTFPWKQPWRTRKRYIWGDPVTITYRSNNRTDAVGLTDPRLLGSLTLPNNM